MKQEIKDILSNYITSDKNCSDEQVNNILGGTKYQNEVKDFMVNNWTEVLEEETELEKDFAPILHKVHHILRVKEHHDKNRFQTRIFKWYKLAAAILLIPIVVSSVVYFLADAKNDKLLASQYSSISIESHQGQVINFDLPDGTKGVLNAGSKLTYSLPFSNNRSLTLSGSAFFEVTHDEKHPFVVSTAKVNVKVLGTKFGIEAYEDDDFTNVLLEEGKVMCGIPMHGKQVILKPDEKLHIEDKKILLSNVNASDMLGWKDGLLIFRDDEMPVVIKKLMRWYNVDISLEDMDLEKYSFRATFENEPLEEVLKLLSRTSPIGYKIEKRTTDKTGKFTKKSVKIYKREK